MANLHVYELVSPGSYEVISEDGALTNPVTSTHDGKVGETTEMKLYVGGDDNTKTYTNIRVSAMSTAGALVEIASVDHAAGGSGRGTSGWGVKLLVDPGYDPKESDWAINYGMTIDIADITASAATTKRPFWFRIESPAGIRVENKTSISLILQFVEA